MRASMSYPVGLLFEILAGETGSDMNRTLLAIGDESDWDSYMKFFRRRKLLKNYRFGFAATTCDSILKGDFPDIPSETLVIYPFFPFDYWDKHIEPRSYRGLYGSKRFYLKWKELWRLIAANLKRHYRDKTVHIINSPKSIPIERDKEATKRALAGAGIRSPRSYQARNIKSILNLVRRPKILCSESSPWRYRSQLHCVLTRECPA